MKNLICLILTLALLLTACGGCSNPAGSGDLSTGGGGESEENSSTAEETPPAARLEFTGNVVFLETEPDFEYEYTINVIEVGGVIVFCGESAEITAFSAESGELLYKADCGDGYVIRLEPYDRKAGYDYRLVMEDRVIYRSTTDGDKELTEALPNGMVFDHTKFPCEVKNVYDINENSFVWAADDGIMLSDSDGSNPRLVLDNSELTDINNVVTDLEFNFELSHPLSFFYQDPRFILDGTKLVAGIISEEGIFYGFVLFNIDTSETEIGHGFYEPEVPIYPVNDRYAVSRASRDCCIVDCLTGEMEYKRIYSSSTYNYKTVVVTEHGMDGKGDPSDHSNLRSYVCDIDDIDDKSKPLVFSVAPHTEAILHTISDNYAIIYTLDHEADANHIYAVKYSE